MVDGEVLTIQPKLLEVYRARWTLSHENTWLAVRSAILWMVCGIYFGLIVPFLVLFTIFVNPRKFDPLLPVFCRICSGWPAFG